MLWRLNKKMYIVVNARWLLSFPSARQFRGGLWDPKRWYKQGWVLGPCITEWGKSPFASSTMVTSIVLWEIHLYYVKSLRLGVISYSREPFLINPKVCGEEGVVTVPSLQKEQTGESSAFVGEFTDNSYTVPHNSQQKAKSGCKGYPCPPWSLKGIEEVSSIVSFSLHGNSRKISSTWCSAGSSDK